MMNYFVNYAWTDYYGREGVTEIKWFETKKEAEEWVAYQKERNGGYFQLHRIEKGNYDDFLKMMELKKKLEKELAELKNRFFMERV